MVWSDPKVQELAKEFVCVAEEVHLIYPEGDWALNRIKDEPGHLLFKGYGAQMPEGDWNDPGTKQGIYMMGPNGEYLEGAHAVSGSSSRLVERLQAALDRWKPLKKDKKYAEEKIPAAAEVAPPQMASAPMALRVSLRDLPRGKGDTSGRRRTKRDLSGRGWMAFVEWAWNQNWYAVSDPAAFVPRGKREEAVPAEAAQALIRATLIDNVRGQNPRWKAEHVKESALSMRVVKKTGKRWEIEYTGSARLDAGKKAYSPTIFGRAQWDPRAKAFTAFRMVAIGEREGAAKFNQRAKDKAPAPMGVLLELHLPAEEAPKGRTKKS